MLLPQPPPIQAVAFESRIERPGSDLARLLATAEIPAVLRLHSLPALPEPRRIFTPTGLPRPDFLGTLPNALFFNTFLLLDEDHDGRITLQELQCGMGRLSSAARKEDSQLLQIFTRAIDAGAGCRTRWSDDYIELSFESPTWSSTVYLRRAEAVIISDAPEKGLPVVTRSNCGDYYCANLFFQLHQAAYAQDSSILQNSAGDPLVGFLHVPRIPRSERRYHDFFAATEKDIFEQILFDSYAPVMAAAVRGYVSAIEKQTSASEELRILITGFSHFGEGDDAVVENPSETFLTKDRRAQVHSMLRSAFGLRFDARTPLILLEQLHDNDGFNHATFYCSIAGRSAPIRIDTIVLPTNDATLSRSGPHSIAQLIKQVQPHAVISCGASAERAWLTGAWGSVWPIRPLFVAETEASDGGLDSGNEKNVPGLSARIVLARNHSLFNAIRAEWDYIK